jgi:zinc transporter ZupT
MQEDIVSVLVTVGTWVSGVLQLGMWLSCVLQSGSRINEPNTPAKRIVNSFAAGSMGAVRSCVAWPSYSC